jgi:hypothetical protein
MSEFVLGVVEALAVIDPSKSHYLVWQPEHEIGCGCEPADSMGCNYLNGQWECGCWLETQPATLRGMPKRLQPKRGMLERLWMHYCPS